MVKRDAVRRGYDELAGAYAAERSEAELEQRVLDDFLEGLAPGARVLDAGCGPGTPRLREVSGRRPAIGLDFSRSQLDQARENAPGAALLRGDMSTLPVRDGTIDAVTALHSLIHVPFSDHQAVIDEFARVLTPTGRLLLSEGPNAWHGSNQDWLDSGVEMAWHIAGIETTKEHLRAAGFVVTGEWRTTQEFAGEEEQWAYVAARVENT